MPQILRSVDWTGVVLCVLLAVGLSDCAGLPSKSLHTNQAKDEIPATPQNRARSRISTGAWLFTTKDTCRATLAATFWSLSFKADGPFVLFSLSCKHDIAARCRDVNATLRFSDVGVHWYHTLHRFLPGEYRLNLKLTPKVESELLAVMSGGKFFITTSAGSTDIVEFTGSGNGAAPWLFCLRR